MRKPLSGSAPEASGMGDDTMIGETTLIGAEAAAESRDKPSTNAHIQVHIGDKLKALYAEVVNQPVPDHLLDLVSKLEAQSKGP